MYGLKGRFLHNSAIRLQEHMHVYDPTIRYPEFVAPISEVGFVLRYIEEYILQCR